MTAIRILHVCAIFAAGVLAGINLSAMLYGGPDHYAVGWYRIGLAVLLGIINGGFAMRAEKDKSR